MTAEDLDGLLAGIAPVIRSYVSDAFADLKKQVAEIGAKAAIPGPGVSSLLISADGRLVAHLTDGRSLDVGPLPVKEGAPGANGRDADPARLQALESELSSLRAELVGKQSEIEALRASAMTPADVQALIEGGREEWIGGLPKPKDGLDGKSVSLEDVAPLISAEVERAVAAIPVPKDGRDGVDGRDGTSVSLEVVADMVLGQVTAAVAKIPEPKDGRDGRSLEVSDVAPLIALEVEKAIAAVPAGKDGLDGKDGQSVSLEDVLPLISAEVQRSVALIPPPKDGEPGIPGLPGVDGRDGTSVDIGEVESLVAAHVGKAVAALPPARDGQDGASVTLEDVAPLIQVEVQKAAALIPAGRDGAPGPAGADGKTVTVEDLAPVVSAEVTKAVASIPAPKDGRDGVGVFGALLDRAGHLVLTLSDGTAKDLGLVVGKDVDLEAVERLILSEVAKIPVPKDGAPGKDGRDGFGFDDVDLVSDERGVFLRFVRGDVTKEFRLPVVVDRGVFSEGRTYGKGDGVTWGGSFWIAQAETTMKPDFTPAAAKSWRLAIKEGRKGKDADPVVIEAMVNKAVAKLPKPKAQDAAKW